MKLRSALCLVLTLVLVSTIVTPVFSQEPVTVLLDDVTLRFEPSPIIEDGRVLVPFRFLAEALGVKVDWDGETRTVLAHGSEGNVELRIDSREAFVNGQVVSLDVPARIVAGRTMVPLRFFTESFGAEVDWDPGTRTVRVESPPADLYTLGFYAIRSFEYRHLIPYLDGVAFGWSRVNAQGELLLDGETFRWPRPAGDITPERILEEAGQEGTERYLMVFAADGQGELTELLSSEAAVHRAVGEIGALVEEKGFDGVLIDFEGLGWTDTGEQLQTVRDSFTNFMALLTLELEDKGVAAALHPLNGAYRGYDYRAIAQYADFIVIMAYDYSRERGPEPVGLVEQAVKMALEEVPAQQLLLGINNWNETGDSIGAKLGLAKRYGLKGVSFWRIGLITGEQWDAIGGHIKLKGEEAPEDEQME